jgi:lysophospholipase L1-like esterase
MIHCLGNSHAAVFTETNEIIPFWPYSQISKSGLFTAHRVGNTLAYNVYERHKQQILDFASTIDKEKDAILFCFGEGDCRWHLGNQAEIQQRPINDITYECVIRYFKIFQDLNDLGYKTIAWGVHPSTSLGHSPVKDKPIFRDQAYRNNVSRMFNTILETLARAYGSVYVDIFNDLVDDKDVTKEEYFQDYCHLNQKVMSIILQRFKEANLI